MRTEACFLRGLLVLGSLAVPVALAGAPAAEHAEALSGRSYLVYVSNEQSGDVTVIDGASRKVVRKIAAGKRPRGIEVSADGRTLYVATSGSPRMGPGADPDRAKGSGADKAADGIAVIDLVAGQVARRLSVGSDPEEFVIGRGGGNVIVANEDVAEASIWNLESGRLIAKADVGEEPEGVARHPTREAVYVTCEEKGELFVLHPGTGDRVARLEPGGRPRAVAFSPDGRLAYVPLEAKAEIAILDAERDRVLETVPVPTPAAPMGVAVAPDGNEVYVTTGRGGGVAVLDARERKVAATIKAGARPWGIALSPDGAYAFTANGPSDDVSVIDLKTRREVARIPAGERPWGVAVGPVVGAD